MLQRFIAITLIACTTGLLTACGSTIQSSNQSNSIKSSPATESTLQLKFPQPPSAEMKNELKREKYNHQSQHSKSGNEAGHEE